MYITTSTGVGWSPLVAKVMVYVKRNRSHFLFFCRFEVINNFGIVFKSEFTLTLLNLYIFIPENNHIRVPKG
jgi:hypothetical protein